MLYRGVDVPAHRVLGLAPKVTIAEVKKAYRALAKQHHPDKTGLGDDYFKALGQAYGILTRGFYTGAAAPVVKRPPLPKVAKIPRGLRNLARAAGGMPVISGQQFVFCQCHVSCVRR